MKKLLSAIAFLLLAACLVIPVYRVLSWKDTTGGYLSNVQQLQATPDNQIDLTFMGTSHVYCGVNPAQIWKEYGISAFDLSISSLDKTASLYFLQDLFQTQSPKVLCLDLYSLFIDIRNSNVDLYRNFLSRSPSLSSLRAILEYQPKDFLSFLFRWPVLHTRYAELTKFDFIPYSPSVFGRGNQYYFRTEFVEQDPAVPISQSITEISVQNKAWLDSIITLCAENHCSLLATVIPFQVSFEQQAVLNGVKQYLQQQGVPCLDMNKDAAKLGLDYSRDFLNLDHLNPYGAEKVTSYLMEYLTTQYSFADHRGDNRYDLWQQSADYDTYQWSKQQLDASSLEDLTTTLHQLQSIPGLMVILSVPQSYTGNDDWQDDLASWGATPEQIAACGQWIFADGKVFAYHSADSESSMAVDLNSADTVCCQNDPAAPVLLNGIATEAKGTSASVVVYDCYECKLLYTLNF